MATRHNDFSDSLVSMFAIRCPSQVPDAWSPLCDGLCRPPRTNILLTVQLLSSGFNFGTIRKQELLRRAAVTVVSTCFGNICGLHALVEI